MIKEKYKLLGLFLIVLLLTGCWDVVDIEDRGFIMGVAIDLAEGGKSNGNYNMELTQQYAVPAGLNTPSKGGGQSGGKAFLNLSASGSSIYTISKEISDRNSKLPFFEHVKVIIVSEEVAEIPQLFTNVMDIFTRDKEARRGVKVIIAKGKAKDLLNVQPENEKLPSQYIDKILDNSLKKTGKMKPEIVGSIHEHLLAKSSFVLPRMSADGMEVKPNGGAVYSGDSNKLVGRINDEEMLGLNLINGEKALGTIHVNFKDYLTTFSIREINSKTKINAIDIENIKIGVTIEIEGEMKETYGTVILEDAGVIKALEKEISAKVKKIADQVMEKGQKELGTDIFGFGDNLQKHHYDTWSGIKENWDQGGNYFAKSDITITVKTKVLTDGDIDKLKN